MKEALFVLFLIASSVLLAYGEEPHLNDDILKAHTECRAEHPVTDEQYKNYLSFAIPQTEYNSNCYWKCFIQKLQLYNDNEGFRPEAIISHLTDENPENLETVKILLGKCVNPKNRIADTCQWIDQVMGCAIKANRSIVLKAIGYN